MNRRDSLLPVGGRPGFKPTRRRRRFGVRPAPSSALSTFGGNRRRRLAILKSQRAYEPFQVCGSRFARRGGGCRSAPLDAQSSDVGGHPALEARRGTAGSRPRRSGEFRQARLRWLASLTLPATCKLPPVDESRLRNSAQARRWDGIQLASAEPRPFRLGCTDCHNATQGRLVSRPAATAPHAGLCGVPSVVHRPSQSPRPYATILGRPASGAEYDA